MVGRVADKVAFVTGAASGQDRSHAVDICQAFDNSPAPGSTPEELAATAEMVKNLDRRVYTPRSMPANSTPLRARWIAAWSSSAGRRSARPITCCEFPGGPGGH